MVVREQQYNHVDYTSYFGDQRLEERGNSIAAEILNKETAVLNQICDTRAELVGTCRFFNNDHVPQLSLVGDAGIRCAELTQGIHVLAIGDTSEINYQHHAGKRNYKKLPIEEKESYRWIASGQKTQELLDQASSITMIYDREADIYEEFVELPDEKTDVIVRSTQNRCLYDQDDKLFEHLCGQSCAGSYTLEIPKGHKKREARTADIEVRVSPVKLCRPMNTANKDLPEYVELYAIEAKEKDSSVPAGEKPILWRLLTTHKITNFADAMQIINWYRWRWIIEQLFRTLKSQGLHVEESQLETGAGLKKLVIMSLNGALRILQLTLGRDGKAGKPATIVFSMKELEFLQVLGKFYEGKTDLQKNPFPVNSLAWAAWIIGRIGGWKGYKKADPAGPITIKRGLEIFNQLFTGWLLQKMCA